MASLTTPLSGLAAMTSATAPAVGKINCYDATSGVLSVTLPALSGLRVGARMVIRKSDTSANTVIVTRAGSDLFQSGATSVVLRLEGEQVELQVISISGTRYWQFVGSVTPLPALDSRLAPVSAYISAVQPPTAAGASTTGSVNQSGGTIQIRTQTGTIAVNDYIEWDVTLRAGTYQLDMWHQKNINVGIYTATLDGGSSLGTIDGYGASVAYAVGTITGITVAATGVHKLRMTMATKNASSSSYAYSIVAITMVRTGA